MSLVFSKRTSKFADCDEGVAFIEFALCIPFLLIVFFGAVEVARYFLCIQKVEKTIDLITDTVTQTNTNQSDTTQNLTPAYINGLYSTVDDMMSPYETNPPNSATRIIIYVSDVSQGTDMSQPPVINWQSCGGGTLAHPSAIGTAGQQPMNLPFTLQAGEEIVVGEIYYNFSPILVQDIIGNIPMSRLVYYTPRFGTLSKPPTPITCP